MSSLLRNALTAASVCSAIAWLSTFVDHLPQFLVSCLAPGFMLVALLHGHLQDSVTRDHFVIAMLADCLVYSLLAMLLVDLFARSRGRTMQSSNV